MSNYSHRENVGAGEWILGAVRRNPEGLLLLAAGAALLMRRSGTLLSTDRIPRQNEHRPGQQDGDNARSENGRNLGERVAQATQAAGEYASDVTERVSRTASAYASSVSDYADEAADRSRRFAQQAQSTLQSTTQQILQEQPLAVALVGFAAGAAVAAAFPATEVEKRALGPTGERLMDAAERAGDHLKEAGAQAGESLMNAAEERGLTGEGLKEVAREVGDAFSTALSGEQTPKQASRASSPRQASVSRHNEQTSRPQGSQCVRRPIQPWRKTRRLMNELANLEREVEMARARLAGNLSTLVSTDTYSAIKEDVKDEARSAIAKMVENLKARAAANPAAALAIGAGLTWRLLQRPPITAALIGAGVISLLRTRPISSNGHFERDYFWEGKERLKEQVGDFADSVKGQAAEVADAVREQVSEFAEGASENVKKWSADAATGAKEQVASLSRQAFSAADDALQSVSGASSAVRTKLNQPDVRDNLLLGVAGAAVAAALGIAYQRRNTWDE